MSAAAEFVKRAIAEHKAIIFSKSYCPYCDKAKLAFKQIGCTPTVIELDMRSDGAQIQTEVSKISHVSTVPNVFINSKFIGGGDDTARLARSGELLKMCQEAGAL